MRIWLPDLRTLPSSTWVTFRRDAISGISIFWPLKEKDEVRAATRNSGILANRFNSSSESPSEKYSCSLSELMLTKGRTAMELSASSASAAGATCSWASWTAVAISAASRPGSSTNLSKANSASASISTTVMVRFSFLPVVPVMD